MKFWNRRNKIEFFHNEPSIIETFPIIESKDLKLNWVKRAREDFQNRVIEDETNDPAFAHLLRCPGIFDLFKYGYVISLHKDVIIEVLDKGFEWQFANSLGLDEKTEKFGIDGFKSQISNMMLKPPWASDFIIKISTGWSVIAPKGVKFIMLPIAYPDTFDFTVSIGILNPAVSTEVNFPMVWNKTEKEKTIIRAGTPLGHLIPLSEKKYEMVQRVANQHDRDWVAKLRSSYNSTFWHYTIRRKVTTMYNKYWKR